MRLGVDISQHQLTWDELLARARYAEDAGFDGAWLFDHFKPLYGDPSGPCMEAWTSMAALAATTTRIRLGVLVTGVTYRPPSILATEVATIDNVSGGRVELGMGAAWFTQEHEELGIDFPPTKQRAGRLEEAVQVMKLLMTRDGARFDGEYYRLRGATYNPKPVQKPHPPLWIGASGEQLMLPLVGRHADAWHAFGRPDDLRRKARIVDEHAEKAGRDPRSILHASALSISEDWDEVTRTAVALRDAGFGYLTVSWPAEGRARVDDFLATVAPKISD